MKTRTNVVKGTRSKIWEYFEINAIDKTRVNCLICNKKLRRGGNDSRSFGTTAFISHLRAKHDDEFKKYYDISRSLKKRKLEEANKTPLQTQDSMFEKKTPFTPDDPRETAITRKIGETSKRTRSKIWEYFEINAIDKTRANCLICNKKLKRGGNDSRSFGTTSFISHLRAKHDDAFKEYYDINRPLKKRKLEEANKMPLQTQDSMFEKKKPSTPDDPRATVITRKIGEMIVSDLLPFNIVSKDGFLRLLHELEPQYVMPSVNYFSRTLIPNMYASVKCKLKELLDATSYISFTCDIWTNDNNCNSFLSLTAHWIDTDWNRMRVVLSVRNLKDSHKSHMISYTILNIIDTWEIPNAKLGVLVGENGTSMAKAAQLTAMPHLDCYIDAIQVVVNQGLKVQRSVCDTIAYARTFVQQLQHSPHATEQLNKIQKSLHIDSTLPCLIQDNDSRWNSTFCMLERLIEQKHAITRYCQDNASVTNLTPHEWNLMEHVLTTLRPFEEETRNASSATATVGMIIPSVKVLKMTLTKPRKAGDDLGIQRMRGEMLKDMEVRFSQIEFNKICVLATALDPIFKLIPFSISSQERVKQVLLDEMIQEADKNENIVRQLPIATANASVTSDSEPKPTTSLDAFYQEMIDTSAVDCKLEITFNSSELMCRQEMHAYLAEARRPRTTPPTDPIVYWKSREHTYPILAALAKRFFATPPSVVDYEHTFSTAGVFCSDKPSQMTASETEMLLFLHRNLNAMNYQY